MRRLASRLPTLIAALLAVLGMVALTGCGGSPQRSALPAATELPDQEVSDFVATETDGGLVQWKMYARSAATYHARNTVVARGVRIDFFDEQGKRSSTLSADGGDMNDLTRDMTARGNVAIQATEGTRMTTDLLHFINKRQRIVTDSFVRVERAGDVLTGYGFESDPDLKNFEFKRQVRATVRTRSGGAVEQRGGTP